MPQPALKWVAARYFVSEHLIRAHIANQLFGTHVQHQSATPMSGRRAAPRIGLKSSSRAIANIEEEHNREFTLV